MEFWCVLVCLSLHLCFLYLFLKSRVYLFSLYFVLFWFLCFIFLVNFLFSNESEKERVDLGGCVWEGSGRSLGRGNYDQNIL